VVNLLPGQPFRAPLKWCAAHNLIFFFHSNNFRQTLFSAACRPSHTVKEPRFEGTKKPIGSLNRDRLAVARPSRVVAAREASSIPPNRSTFFVMFFEIFSNFAVTRWIVAFFLWPRRLKIRARNDSWPPYGPQHRRIRASVAMFSARTPQTPMGSVPLFEHSPPPATTSSCSKSGTDPIGVAGTRQGGSGTGY